MLTVRTPDEVLELIKAEFKPIQNNTETVGIDEAIGRVLCEDIIANEYVPDFNRSTVDGYAVSAKDTFGCTDAIPAILPVCGQVLMGEGADFILPKDQCCYVPTGGAVPNGADCCIMIEYTENYGDGTIGISKAGAPGQNIIFRGDDVCPGKTILKKGRILASQDIGALAAIGVVEVPVIKKPRIGIISTGDELIPPNQNPRPGQMRDVNTYMLCAMMSAIGTKCISYGIVADDEDKLAQMMEKATDECDVVLISGGSSVGVKDATCRIIERIGKLLLHGIAMKPGKPSILGKRDNVPIFGLPGHPVAAYFVNRIFVLPLIARLMDIELPIYTIKAILTEDVGANHGRAQFGCVRLYEENGKLFAQPVHSKSGLITTLAGADGYFCIDRDCEGLLAGTEIDVTICKGD